MLKRHFLKIVRWIIKAVFAFMIVTFFIAVGLKFFNPPITAMMVYKYIQNDHKSIQQEWVQLDEVNATVPLAIIAAEDQNYLNHSGFDFTAIKKAIQHNKTSKTRWGASTISQQLAKNIFLFPTKSILRKGLEAYFTVVLELVLNKKRIMELYINVVETGDSYYGVGVASKHYFRKSAQNIQTEEAALIAAALPNPIVFKVSRPSDYMQKRKRWIVSQMNNLGGTELIKDWYK